MNKFWFVWRSDGPAPQYKHPSLASAITESKRLAKVSPGETFVVLEAVGASRTVDPVRYFQLQATGNAGELADGGVFADPFDE